MKRHLSVLVFMIIIVFMLAGFSTSIAEIQQRKITVMVYMCGSNLESFYGSASADIHEMLEANVNENKVGLLIMTGGSSRNTGNFNPTSTQIIEIANTKKRCIKETESLNMGAAESLTWFIRYCMENRPADEYALILWDHGGGPLEGVCWDESNNMDHLSLSEITQALSETKQEKKLSWIGFDACLMSSLEVAVHLEPYADYMIASQETEPSFGWNYSFLAELHNDTDATETGRRIVDAYFAGQEQSKENLSLACIDLKKTSDAAEALGDYFSDIEKTLNTNTFSQLSNLRMSSVSFGDSIRGTSNSGYDLVDAIDLVSHIDINASTTEHMLSLIENAIVYNRSNIPGATGLSVYHPYSNIKKFLSDWKDNYTAIGLNDEYMRYIQSFGAILTGEQLVRWNQLKTSIESKVPDGTHSFSVQLSPEQTEHFASGQLLILRDTSGSHILSDGVAVVSVNHASLDENGLLTAQYDNSMLYVENGNGDLLGPLSFTQTSNGLYNVVRSAYIPLEDYGLHNYKSVLLYLDANDKSEHPDVIQTRVWDDATQTYSSRLGISEDPYRMIQFFNSNRAYPTEIDGILPEYNAWDDRGLLTGTNLLLPDAWKFTRLKDQTTYSQLYAMFQITDVQQNVCCTLPVPIKNPNFTDLSSASDIETLGCTISLSGCVNASDSPSLHLILSIINNDDHDGLFSIQDVKINDHRQLMNKMSSRSIAKDQRIIHEWDINPEYLAQIDEIKTISFQFVKETGNNQKGAEYVQFVVDNCDLQNIYPVKSIGNGKENGISLDVLNIQPSTTGGFDITMLINNNSDVNIYPHSLILNDIQLSSSSLDVIHPGSSRVIVSNWENALLLDETELSIHNEKTLLSLIPVSQHILSQHGYNEVQKITLAFTDTDDYHRGNWGKVTALLNEPWTIEETEDNKINSYFTVIQILKSPEANQVASLVPISESDRYIISFRRLIIGKEQVVVVLEMTNRTNDFINILAEETYINNDICSSYPFRFSNEVWIAPNSTTIKPVIINKYDGVTSGLEISHITLNMHDRDEMIESSGIITPTISVKTGEDELIWIDAGQVEIEPIRLAPVDTREPVALLDDILMTENAIDCLQWIEAPLSDDELLNVSDVQMYLVIPDDTSLAVISKQSATKNEQGKYGVLSPGLIACSATDKDALLTTIIKNTNKDLLNASVFSRFIIQNDDYMNIKFMVIRSIQFSVDYNQNTAMIIDKEVDGDVFERQSEMVFLTWAKYVVYSETGNDGKMIPFKDMKVETNLITGWEEIINEQPFQIMLRPITPEDNIMVLFSITNQDGTGYSYMQPYPNPIQ